MRITLLLLLTLLTGALAAQDLDAYVQQALDNNLTLQQQQLSYQEALAQLDQAKALFWPKLSIEGRYSVARGGRTISIPAGDLVNPAYQNLNYLNQYAAGLDPTYPAFPMYPTVENQETNFLRETEQETTVRLEMPVYNRSLILNQRLRENMAQAADAGREIYRQALIKDVKVAYYAYARATYGQRIYEDALALVEENLRTTESLERNHKALPADVYSARAQVADIQQQLATARQQVQAARAYFNTLLNRPYETTIELPGQFETLEMDPLSLEEARQQGMQEREELQQLNYYLGAAEQQLSLARGQRLPSVNLRADYGIQGTRYDLSPEADFFMGSVVFSIPLYNRATSAKVQEAELAYRRLTTQKEAARQQIGLQIVNEYYALLAAEERIASARAQREAADASFRLVQRQYEQGLTNQVTFTEARTQLTRSEENLLLAQFDYLTQRAEFDWAIARSADFQVRE